MGPWSCLYYCNSARASLLTHAHLPSSYSGIMMAIISKKGLPKGVATSKRTVRINLNGKKRWSGAAKARWTLGKFPPRCFNVTKAKTNEPTRIYTQVQTALDLTEKSVILEPQNPTIDEFHLVQKRRPTDFETLKLRNVRSGIFEITYRKVELSVLFHSEKENTFLFVYFFVLKTYFRTSVWHLKSYCTSLLWPPYWETPIVLLAQL